MAFWEQRRVRGGALDLSQSSDSSAHELERRIALSQYLTAIQSRVNLPPADRACLQQLVWQVSF
ncbi:MAG: hypothetical protein LBG43_01120 [Treponema sp.]|jgi:hypothetical protein|nr:hypothetical protein [Treponema sp.]